MADLICLMYSLTIEALSVNMLIQQQSKIDVYGKHFAAPLAVRI